MKAMHQVLRDLDCARFEYRPNGEWGMPDDVRYAACGTRVQPIHLRYLIDLRSCVVADGSRPDVVADMDDLIDQFNDAIYGQCPIADRSMVEAAIDAIFEARRGGFWDHSPEALINELCNPDRLRDLVCEALKDDFSDSVAGEAADCWLKFFRQAYH